MRFRSGVLVALGAAALVAGCGGGGGGGGDRLSKEEYIAKADAICKEADDKITALGDPQNFEELASLASEAATIGEEELSALRALLPPEADEATLNQAYGLIGQQLELAKQIAAAAKEGDQAKIQGLIDQGTPFQEQAQQIAQDYGLKECGSEG